MRLSPDAARALAAQYVLGTLRGGARRRLEALLREDRALAQEVRRWEDALTPMAEATAPIEPPKRVWSNIESRVSSARPTAPAAGFWRGFGLIAGGLASVLLAFFVSLANGPREPMFVAVLADTAPRVVVSMREPDLMRVTVMRPWNGMENRSLELWVLPKDGGAPRSLGLVYNVPGDTMLHISPSDPRVRDAKALAVSMEPAGGSPTGRPTGAVVCSGMIAPVKPQHI
jgi:anti-sigma-K factor RskA